MGILNPTWTSDCGRVTAEKRNLTVLSLGAGVQSTTLLLMALNGELPRPDCAIFADTGWEPSATYGHLAWLKRYSSERGLEIHHVQKGNLKNDMLSVAGTQRSRIANPPYFVRNPDGSAGMLHRQCTREYKIEVIEKKCRELMGYKPRQRIKHICTKWVGISLDEIIRMKPSRTEWEHIVFPLIDARMTRQDCLLWLKKNGFPTPPKSACIGCPFHSNAFYKRMKKEFPEEFVDVVNFDNEIRAKGLRGVENGIYVHRSLIPLQDVDLRENQGELFGNECDGYCGV